MSSEADFPSDLRALEREYELIRELGQGGMAAVYLARRRDNGRLVAIKAIRGRYLDDPDAVQRFAREARTVAGLDHPNIVRTEAIEQIDNRAVAIIMEHVAGGTVRDRLREHGSLGAEDAEGILRDVANALAYAHRRGIVHRDVKPENIFLDAVRRRALLSDFGIARTIDGDAGITLLGAALGTPQYMSPEQTDGEMVDGRSDIYSLGVLGWEVLTGRRPWAGESLYGVIYKQKHEDLPRITSLRPRVPANLLFAIEGALIKDKAQRWQTIDEFLDQLTYNPPPLLSQTYPPRAAATDDQPTVQFRAVPLEPADPVSGASAPTDLEPSVEVSDAREPTPLFESVRDVSPVPVAVLPSAEPVGDRLADALAEPARVDADYSLPEFDLNAEPSFEFTPRRTRVLQALGLLVPIGIAATSLFIIFGGSARDAARGSKGGSLVTTSAGSVAADSAPAATTVVPTGRDILSAAPTRRDSVIGAGGSVVSGMASNSVAPTPAPRKSATSPSTRTGGSTTARLPQPTRREMRADSNRAVAPAGGSVAPMDSSASRRVVTKTEAATNPRPVSDRPVDDPFRIPPGTSPPSPALGAGAGPSPRCRIAGTADQRACLAAYIDAGDVPLNRVFDSLVSEMRRVAHTPAGAPDPQTVQRVRVEQRTWLSVRDSECPRQQPAGSGPFWAQARSQCFAEMAAARTEDLRDVVRRLRRK